MPQMRRVHGEAVAKSAALLKRCSLARPGVGGGCGWCCAPLPAGRRTWCRDRCATAFWKNHWWTLARQAAKRRDKYRCVRCRHFPPKRPAAVDFAVRAAYLAAFRGWRLSRPAARLEVNHIKPCLGAHGTPSCAHHLSNLETLCVVCHRARTRAQRL